MNEEVVKRMVEFVTAAERGDSSASLPIRSEGRLGELERALNRLVDELRAGRDRWDEQKALQKELKLSRVIQNSLLPSIKPAIPGIEIEALYRTAKQVGGDYYDYIEIDANHLGIAVADVAGKSVSGAMLMTITRNTLHSQAMLTLSPAEVLDRTEKLLSPNMMSRFFVSIFYAVLDRRTHRLVCANAGHPPMMFYRSEEQNCEWIRPAGLAVGLSRWALHPVAREETEVVLREGDLAFLFTDGVTDVQNPMGEYFGRERLVAVARESAVKGDFLSHLEKELVAFGGDGEQGDDITAVVIKKLKKEIPH